MVLIASFQRRSKSKREESEPPKFCCIPCSRPLSEECGTCKYCKDKPKNGGTYILRQKCILRTCVKKKKSSKTSSGKYKKEWMMINVCFISLLWKIYCIILNLNVAFAVCSDFYVIWLINQLSNQPKQSCEKFTGLSLDSYAIASTWWLCNWPLSDWDTLGPIRKHYRQLLHCCLPCYFTICSSFPGQLTHRGHLAY